MAELVLEAWPAIQGYRMGAHAFSSGENQVSGIKMLAVDMDGRHAGRWRPNNALLANKRFMIGRPRREPPSTGTTPSGSLFGKIITWIMSHGYAPRWTDWGT